MKKNKLIYRLSQLYDIITIPGIFKARTAGIYFNMYKMMFNVFNQGVDFNTFIDVGASTGMFSKTCNYFYNKAQIFAFEPLIESYKELSKLKDTIKRFESFNIALGEENRSDFINKSSYHYSSSLLEMSQVHKEAFPYSANSEKEKIDVYSLDSILNNKQFEGPTLMKIDVQGYELKVLEGARNTLKKCDFIVIELSLKELYLGQPSFDNIYNFITGKGFVISDILQLSRNPSTFELLQMDVLFKKSD